MVSAQYALSRLRWLAKTTQYFVHLPHRRDRARSNVEVSNANCAEAAHRIAACVTNCTPRPTGHSGRTHLLSSRHWREGVGRVHIVETFSRPVGRDKPPRLLGSPVPSPTIRTRLPLGERNSTPTAGSRRSGLAATSRTCLQDAGEHRHSDCSRFHMG